MPIFIFYTGHAMYGRRTEACPCKSLKIAKTLVKYCNSDCDSAGFKPCSYLTDCDGCSREEKCSSVEGWGHKSSNQKELWTGWREKKERKQSNLWVQKCLNNILMSVWTWLQKIFKFVFGLTVKASREFCLIGREIHCGGEWWQKKQYTICLNHVLI